MGAMGQHHSERNRESEAVADERSLPSTPDLVFTTGLSLAIVAGLALGFIFR
ncbi:hypothetical protein IAG41_19715 [Sphingomonas sp. JC676]|uniref:hypothetical protein n=1 Tax=Sphingomonas sp. JC676 TaxID=2768065 RepID=UPI001657E829|nr:hypothetical protein [Sphingomonas sp. JC676]MBC9034623.1 hypothetical protein [Sphingomonas sp. JC676]